MGHGIPILETKPTIAFDILLQCQNRTDVNDTAFIFFVFSLSDLLRSAQWVPASSLTV
jgi:hypothetical protein